MPRGRLIDAPQARPFAPPETTLATGGSDGVAGALEAGFREGLARGREEARAAAAADEAQRLARQAAVFEALHQLEQRIISESAVQLTALALKIAERIVRAKIEAGDPVAVRIAEELLARAQGSPARVVSVNAEDFDALMALAPRLADSGSIQVVADAALQRGDVVVTTPVETLDGRVGTALELFADALEERE